VTIPAVPTGLSATLVAGPTNGTVDLAADGTFVYTPAPGFTGTDTFTYVASDLYGSSEPATVTLEVVAEGVPAAGPAAVPAVPVRATPGFTG